MRDALHSNRMQLAVSDWVDQIYRALFRERNRWHST